ncbi:secreted RxLR effector protein 161-like [Tasmannia lanceolata]|uniref:secreted RxLR effector protein 161-like n=1 Tax=Tasmannia lanceolata TaxID=3420 RepID=UPI004062E2DE
MSQSKRSVTPLDPNIKIRREEGKLLPDPQPYRPLVDSLIYLTIIRPDISFSIGLASRYMQAPRKPHLEAAKRILKYVNSTLDFGLLYRRGVDFVLNGFTDADYGGDLDDRRSTSDYVFLFRSAGVS